MPRSERYAGLQALRVAPHLETLCSDHLAFVREGLSWDSFLATASGKHADVWRQIFNECNPSRCPPEFVWVRAHRALEDVLDLEPQAIMDYLGNHWADFFARMGAQCNQVAQVAVDAEAAHLKQNKLTWQFLASAVQTVSAMASCVEGPEEPSRAVHSGPRLSVAHHDLHFFPALGMWRCRACNVSATAQSTLLGLKSGAARHCHPSSIQRWRAQQFFADNPGSVPDSNAPGVLAAETLVPGRPPGSVLSPGASSSSGAQGSTGRGADGLEIFRDLSHRPVRYGRIIICHACTCFLILPDGTCRGLKRPCNGVARTKADGYVHARKLANAERGKHPTTGVPVEPAPSAAPGSPSLRRVAQALRLEEAATRPIGGEGRGRRPPSDSGEGSD